MRILTWHSISEEGGPTAIPLEVFRMQLDVLVERGLSGTSLSGALASDLDEPPRVALTFDDAYEDFATAALPEIVDRGFSATLFVVAGHAGGTNEWDRGRGLPRRPLLGWDALAGAAAAGVELGSHGWSHADLAAAGADVERELVASRLEIERRTGARVGSFAYPYGRASAPAVDRARAEYAAAVTTELAEVRSGADLHRLPRLDMTYFREPVRWRRCLDGRDRMRLTFRRALRSVRGR